MSRFQAGGVSLKLLWYGFMLTAVLLAPLAVLLGQVLDREQPGHRPHGDRGRHPRGRGAVRRACPLALPGPHLARRYDDPASTEATREATVVVFESFHIYLGVAIGECLGYLFTGAWTVLVGVAMLQSSAFDAWLA